MCVCANSALSKNSKRRRVLLAGMSWSSKPIRKVLPAIPSGVEPAPSPRLAHSRGNPAFALLAHSPLLPRSQLPSVLGKAKRDLQHAAAQSSLLLDPGATGKRASGLLEPGKTTASVQRVSVEDGEDCAVTVAVRVRPFSKRELALDAKQVVSMAANRTTITSTKGKAHFFSYDHSFWSVCDPDAGTEKDSVYASQELVYTELAQPLLDSSFRGYNTCLFAYGQTGSGKSYCIMGEGENLGIVPRFMRELFERVDGTSDSKNTYNVQVSYFEIYNEKVYDLLSHSAKRYSSGSRKRPKLRVREHKVFGPYVEDLSTYVATSYSDIEHWLAVGNRCRATNATSMNDRSSRSHAVFAVTLTHTTVEQEQEHNTVSHINIIDLAGSERSKVAETAGERLKEGASINRSLHSLGKVISLLSERSTGRRAKVYIPYRDSTLTWLLKESLGGNSKTAMIATISPADTHYEESLSTLRYAQQARNIVNVARVNEDPNVKMIRELTSEIHHLRGLLAEQGGESGLVELRKLREQLSESEKLMSEATRSWEEKLQETERRKKEELEEVKRTGALVLNNKLPNLVNLTEDPQLSETLLYVLKPGRTTVGNMGARDEEGSGQSHDIELTGALVVKDHCVFVHESTTVQLQPSSSPDAQTFLNGQLLSAPTTLHHGDRVVLGGDYFFRFNYPMEVEAGSSSNKKGHRDFEFAKDEWVKAQTSRLEHEWEEKLIKERKEMLRELEGQKQTAEAEMDRQQQEFKEKLHTLNREMETQSQHLTAEQRTKQEAVLLAEELKRRNQALEEETIAQRHIIHLEKIKTEQESRELEEQRNQLMMDLEQEKQRLEDDITKLHKNKSMRESHLSPSPSESLLINGQSSSSDTSLQRGSQLVHISMMLQEAAAICKALNKPLVFSREEGGDGGVTVRVSNTLHKMVAYWDLSKFECRLEQMRELYQTRGSATSLEEVGTTSPTLSEDPFNDPADDWAPSPLRSLHQNHSLQSTPVSLATPTSLGRVPHFDPYHSKSSYYNSPLLVTTPHRERPRYPSSYFAVAGVLKEIGQLLDWREGEERTRLVDRMCNHISLLRTQSEQFSQLLLQPNKIDGEGVVGAAVSMCCCLEKMVETCHCLQTMALQWRTVMSHYHLKEHVSGVGVVSQLQETLCHQTALYCSKLLKSEGGEGGVECCELVWTSLDSVAQLLGQLLLVTLTQQRLLAEHFARHESPEEKATSWPECSLKASLRQGVCQRCMADLDLTTQTLRSNISTLASCDPTSQVPRTSLEAMQQLITTALKFIEWLHAVQEEILSDENDTPSVSDVVTMVIAVHQVCASFSSMTAAVVDHTPSKPVDMQSLTSSPGGKCQQLAVAVLSMLKTTQQGTVHTSHVQTHSQFMAKAAKHLNQLLKTSPIHHYN